MKMLVSTFKAQLKDSLDKYNEAHGTKFSAFYHLNCKGFNIWQGKVPLGRVCYDNGQVFYYIGKDISNKHHTELVNTALVSLIEATAKPSVFQFFQPNPTEGNKCTKGDCAIRAMCKALDIDWRTAMTELCKWAIEHYCIPNSLNDTLKPYLLENGYRFVGAGKERPTAEEFARSHPTGTYYLYVQSGYQTHAMTLKDGIVYDAWDSTGCYLYGFFTKE